MAQTRGANTMSEQLRGMLGQIAEMKAAPDADIAYLTNLETQVLQFLRMPFEKQRLEAQLGGPAAGAAVPGAGATPAQPPAPGPAEQLLFGTPPPRQRVPGVMNGPNMPAPDELRRLMEQPAL